MRKKNFMTYVLLGDGECQEGQVWEAALFASHYKLDTLIAIIDKNGYQVSGNVNKVLSLEPLKEKWHSFHWEVFEIDGHNIAEIVSILKGMKLNGFPKMIITNTVKGKGVSFMENNIKWHSFNQLTSEEMEIAKKELGLI